MRNKMNFIRDGVARTMGKVAKTSSSRGIKGLAAKAVLTAAIATANLGLAGNAWGALADVQTVATNLIPGSATTVPGVSGYGNSTTGFLPSKTYNMTYENEDLEITQINTSTASYVPTIIANTIVRRDGTAPNNDVLWYRASAGSNVNSSTLDLLGPASSTIAQAFDGNNLLVGTDNLFNNKGNTADNNTNIERLDMLFSSTISASASNVFAIFDRGVNNDHDSFKIAAITAVDQNGNPSNYGKVLTVGRGTWGKPNVVPNENYIVVRKNDSISNDPMHPSDNRNQTVGGVVIPTSDLVPANTPIFGYSLFAADVTGTGSNLDDWTNSSFYPTNTTETNGGLDALGTSAVLFTAVPEPTTTSMVAIAAGALLTRRGNRRKAVRA